jgi:predicted nucleic acid-binding protein
VVFDTNVLYSALAAKGFCEEVVDEAVAECDIVWLNVEGGTRITCHAPA